MLHPIIVPAPLFDLMKKEKMLDSKNKFIIKSKTWGHLRGTTIIKSKMPPIDINK